MGCRSSQRGRRAAGLCARVSRRQGQQRVNPVCRSGEIQVDASRSDRPLALASVLGVNASLGQVRRTDFSSHPEPVHQFCAAPKRENAGVECLHPQTEAPSDDIWMFTVVLWLPILESDEGQMFSHTGGGAPSGHRQVSSSGSGPKIRLIILGSVLPLTTI